MKQNLENFEEDKAFNQQNPLFSPLNDAYEVFKPFATQEISQIFEEIIK